MKRFRKYLIFILIGLVFIGTFAYLFKRSKPKEIRSVPGELQKHNENTYQSRYVWLPIEWEGDKPVIRWQKEWRPEDLT